MSLRALKSVLHNFLGSFTSRYTDYNGYSFWGFVLPYLDFYEIDLLKRNKNYTENILLNEFSDLANRIFLDQLGKHRIETYEILKAKLIFTIVDSSQTIDVNGYLTNASTIKVYAEAQTGLYRIYDKTMYITVAKHNPEIEFKSAGR